MQQQHLIQPRRLLLVLVVVSLTSVALVVSATPTTTTSTTAAATIISSSSTIAVDLASLASSENKQLTTPVQLLEDAYQSLSAAHSSAANYLSTLEGQDGIGTIHGVVT